MFNINDYIVSEETFLKAKILTHGIVFTQTAIQLAKEKKAKGQNLVYNMPLNTDAFRPQELILSSRSDGYRTVVSCVAANKYREPIVLDASADGRISVKSGDDIDFTNMLDIEFVPEPIYYRKTLSNGECVNKYVSACGLDELNIFPWKGCAISKPCLFCGTNFFVKAGDISAKNMDAGFWEKNRDLYIYQLCKSIEIAQNDDCYSEHMHVILIAGNLANDMLDLEADIFAEIAQNISPLIEKKSEEGLVLVITPPHDISKLRMLYNSGIRKIVFNMEAIQPKYFKKYCPGKEDLGYEYIIHRLKESVRVFGKGNVWSNLVYGLEPSKETIDRCGNMAEHGIVMGANVLHLDLGNRLDCGVPSIEQVIDFFFKLERINNYHGYTPYYCSLALRTSLSNEAHDGRIKRKEEGCM